MVTAALARREQCPKTKIRPTSSMVPSESWVTARFSSARCPKCRNEKADPQNEFLNGTLFSCQLRGSSEVVLRGRRSDRRSLPLRFAQCQGGTSSNDELSVPANTHSRTRPSGCFCCSRWEAGRRYRRVGRRGHRWSPKRCFRWSDRGAPGWAYRPSQS